MKMKKKKYEIDRNKESILIRMKKKIFFRISITRCISKIIIIINALFDRQKVKFKIISIKSIPLLPFSEKFITNQAMFKIF